MIISLIIFVIGCVIFLLGLVMWIYTFIKRKEDIVRLNFWLGVLLFGNIFVQLGNILVKHLK